MERTLTYDGTKLTKGQLERWEFVKIAMPSPIGTLRFTNHRDGAQTLNIDGTGSALWSWMDFIVGPLDQGENSILSVSWLSFVNLDNTFTNWASDPGLRRRDVEVWRGWYDAETFVFDHAILAYGGVIGGHELGPRATLNLKPHGANWPQYAPWALPGPLCYYPYKDPDTCQYAGAEPVGELTCPHTRAGCTARGNTARFPCDDLAPIPGTVVYLGPQS